MADAITIKALQDASLDAKSLEEVVNGNEVKQVTTRKGETYPSVKKAIKTLFENGGLPATPFKTKALMTASALIDGKYAMVTDDTVNNGLYVKTAGAWVKSAYDPLAQAKADATTKADAAKAAAISEFKANDGAVKYGQDYFTELGGYSPTGVLGGGGFDLLRHTPRVSVIKGEKVIVKTDITSSGSLRIVFFNSMGAVSKVVNSTAVEPAYTPHEAIADEDGFVSTHCLSASSTGCSITVGVGSDLFVKTKDAVRQSDIDKKADTTKRVDFKDFELGYVDSSGNDIASTIYLRSPVYKFKIGTVINLNRLVSSGYQLGYSTSDTNKVTHRSGQWFAQQELVVTLTKPYIRFFIKKTTAGDISASAATTVSNIHTFKNVVYDLDIAANSSVGLSSVGSPPLNSMFRTPSLATGGVLSIIDDDGRDAVYSGLYPFLKANGVPFGSAIVASGIGGAKNGKPYMTLAQLKELAADTEFFEVMSHSWSHGSQVDASTTLAEKEVEVMKAKEWFINNGISSVEGFVYPYGAEDSAAWSRVLAHHNCAYDYGEAAKVENFSNIKNYKISRTAWSINANNLAYHKTLLDEAVANNGWLVICTHVDSNAYWDSNSYAALQEFIDYAKSKGVKFMLPKHGFQTFGNIVENDSGFKIQANGKIVGAS